LATLMRPSHPVRHFWPLRNQRFLCSRLRSGLLVERLGMQTRLWALHANAYDYTAMNRNATARQVQRYETVFKSTIYETEHPVVQVHPLSGERAIMAISFAGSSASVRQTRRICLPCCRIT